MHGRSRDIAGIYHTSSLCRSIPGERPEHIDPCQTLLSLLEIRGQLVASYQDGMDPRPPHFGQVFPSFVPFPWQSGQVFSRSGPRSGPRSMLNIVMSSILCGLASFLVDRVLDVSHLESPLCFQRNRWHQFRRRTECTCYR